MEILGGESLRDVVTTFGIEYGPARQLNNRSGHFVREVPSLGVISVKAKRLGPAWNPSSFLNDGGESKTLHIFTLDDGALEEMTEGHTAGARYMVDVRIG